jgi:hypothetical protein
VVSVQDRQVKEIKGYHWDREKQDFETVAV